MSYPVLHLVGIVISVSPANMDPSKSCPGFLRGPRLALSAESGHHSDFVKSCCYIYGRGPVYRLLAEGSTGQIKRKAEGGVQGDSLTTLSCHGVAEKFQVHKPFRPPQTSPADEALDIHPRRFPSTALFLRLPFCPPRTTVSTTNLSSMCDPEPPPPQRIVLKSCRSSDIGGKTNQNFCFGENDGGGVT